MPRAVPFLSEDQIERDAVALIAEFEKERGVIVEAPVPIEDIVEKHLKLRIEFDDMHGLIGIPRPNTRLGLDPDILGAIYFDDGRVVIDEALDPDERPNREGRYRFTLAHEGGGHWRLHRPLFGGNPDQDWLFDEPPPPSVICRSSQARERVEWQADFYASCLLMPRALLLTDWQGHFGNTSPRIVRMKNRMALPVESTDPVVLAARKMHQQLDDQALEDFVRPFAERFKVSPIAMRIRLEKLELLHRDTPRQASLALPR